MQTLLINQNTEKTVGTDTSFSVQLDKTYTCRKMILDSIQMPNLFSNFPYNNDFTFQTGAGSFYFSVNSGLYLNLSDFITYFNANNTAGLTLTLSIQYNIITLTGNIFWSPVGASWTRFFGYNDLYPTRPLGTGQIADTYYNFTQSSVINISIKNIPSAYTGEAPVTYQIPLSGQYAFGQIIDLTFEQGYDNQNQVNFFTDTVFNQLQIDILDESYQQLLVYPNNNNDQFNVTMKLGLFLEI